MKARASSGRLRHKIAERVIALLVEHLLHEDPADAPPDGAVAQESHLLRVDDAVRAFTMATMTRMSRIRSLVVAKAAFTGLGAMVVGRTQREYGTTASRL